MPRPAASRAAVASSSCPIRTLRSYPTCFARVTLSCSAHLQRQILLGQPGLEHKEDAGQRSAILLKRTATPRVSRVGRQQGRNHRPEIIRNQPLGHATQMVTGISTFEVVLGVLGLNPNCHLRSMD